MKSRGCDHVLVLLMPCSQKRSEMITDNGSGCVYGEGDGCAALAEGNEFILALQKKSRDNRAKNELELYEKVRRTRSCLRLRAAQHERVLACTRHFP